MSGWRDETSQAKGEIGEEDWSSSNLKNEGMSSMLMTVGLSLIRCVKLGEEGGGQLGSSRKTRGVRVGVNYQT